MRRRRTFKPKKPKKKYRVNPKTFKQELLKKKYRVKPGLPKRRYRKRFSI